MPAFMQKTRDVTWEKIGKFIDIDNAKLEGVSALKQAEVSILFDSRHCENIGSVLERWPKVTFNWHYECDEIFYIVEGGPIRVTCEGKILEGGAGDIFLFNRGTDLTFEILGELVGLTVHFPKFEEIYQRYKNRAERV
ncbi:MAG TPA: cupin domain-containing protein [Thermodesulfobacteriota bacterium]|jgi:ethanolamine utilization protein EutQ (cupin superfamily)|nr:cupin domain-containing protein [Thermodesulfobacteriota bacterium]